MGKILTKLSKETDKARLQAASTKTSPFKVNIAAVAMPAPPLLEGVCNGWRSRPLMVSMSGNGVDK